MKKRKTRVDGCCRNNEQMKIYTSEFLDVNVNCVF